jgi:hypothetical protein
MKSFKDGTKYRNDNPIDEANIKLANASFLRKLIQDRVDLEKIDSPIKNELIKEVNILIEHYKKLC